MIVTKWVVITKVAKFDFEVESEDDEVLVSNMTLSSAVALDGLIYSIEDTEEDAIDTAERLTAI